MMDVKMPVLLDEELNELKVLYPTKGSLKLNLNSVSEATLTMPDKADTIPMHAFVKIYNQLGFVGIFRRTSKASNIGTDNSFTLRHGIDILQDSVWNEQTTFEGTKAEYIEELLDHQVQVIKGPGDSTPRKPWVLGRCDDQSDVEQDINYDNLMTLVEGLVEDGDEYELSFDQSGWPWTVNLVQKSHSVESEFRLDRNVEKCQIKENDSELCTRLILSVNQMVEDSSLSDVSTSVSQNSTVIRVYDKPAAQAQYGVIIKTADIDTTHDTFPNGPFPEADAWAEDFFHRRQTPKVQIEIDGYVLKRLTGDTWDETKLGTMVRVALPDYAQAISERCVTINYSDLYGTPDKVSVSLSNTLPSVTSSIASIQSSVSSSASSSRKSAREASNFQQHFKITDKNDNILKQAGLQLDANGLLVYADDNVNMVGSRFNVQADQIGMVVGTEDGVNFIKAGEIALSINGQTGESKILLAADVIDIVGIIESIETWDITVGTIEADQGASVFKQVVLGPAGSGEATIECEGTAEFEDTYIDELYVEDSNNTYQAATWQSQTIRTYTLSAAHDFQYENNQGVLSYVNGKIITNTSQTTIHYLGRAST